MTCYCGDICCWSCGPAQGNWKCILCGQWMTEGYDHISAQTGKYKKKYSAQVRKAEEEENRTAEEEWRMTREADKAEEKLAKKGII